MNNPEKTVKWFLFALSLVFSLANASIVTNNTSIAEVRELFASPPTEYSSAPLWVWNDMLTEEQVTSTMNDLAAQKVKQVFVHPRPGLMTPYLSEEWFKLWNAALVQAEKLDMNVWIYDENSYPSGFAGGLVPEAMPESRGRDIIAVEHKKAPKRSTDTFAVFSLIDNKYVNLTDRLDSNDLPLGEYLEIKFQYAPTGGWFGGKYYVDLLKPGVTQKFIEITMGAYKSNIGDQFGKRVPGVFTDEPHLCPGKGLHWTSDLEEQFQQKWGYSIVDNLPSLFKEVGDFKRIRHNYYSTLLTLFIDRWAKPWFHYCSDNNLEFTGHYWEHGWPGASHGSDNMAMYAWHQRPAIDILMNQYKETTNAQFGNVRAVKELSSVANQLGQKRTLCEAYGAGGWDLRFEDMKRIGDWLYVLGVNTLDEHLSYVTIRGARKRDHPQSFSYHEPWWNAYHVMAEYFTRLSAALSQGQEINDILVIEPTSSAWMYQGMNKDLDKIGNSFQQLVTSLSTAQAEYDIGSEDIIDRNGSISGNKLVIGQRQYHTVVISPFTENLNSKTMALLEDFLDNGGKVLCCGKEPERIDGLTSDKGKQLAAKQNWKTVKSQDLPEALATAGEFKLIRNAGDNGILYHQRRHLNDGQLLFLVNTSIDSPSAGTIKSACLGIEQMDPQSGKFGSYPFSQVSNGIKTEFKLEPCASLLLFLSDKPAGEAATENKNTNAVKPAGLLQAKRIGPNVLTIDYMDVSAGDQTKQDIYFYKANQLVFQQHGMDVNPWDHAVQFRDELITKTFEKESGFEARYNFMIEQKLPESLWLVIERTDLYEITCNGKPIIAAAGSWWLDRSFGKIDIKDLVVLGENTVTIKASPFTMYHELEPAYVIGEFTLKTATNGFTIIGSGSNLKTGSWKQQGCPFYSEGVSYMQEFAIDKPAGRYFVDLVKWYGSVAQVKVNGKSAGYIAYRPWQCDVTDLICPGTNTIEVIVIGTLRNTLGPHHKDVLGSTWPAMFHSAPQNPPAGDKYFVIDYGLFEPFSLRQVSE